MSEIKNTLPGAGTPDRATEPGAACEGVSNSAYNCTMPADIRQRSIADLLGHGQNAAITRRDLENITG